MKRSRYLDRFDPRIVANNCLDQYVRPYVATSVAAKDGDAETAGTTKTVNARAAKSRAPYRSAAACARRGAKQAARKAGMTFKGWCKRHPNVDVSIAPIKKAPRKPAPPKVPKAVKPPKKSKADRAAVK